MANSDENWYRCRRGVASTDSRSAINQPTRVRASTTAATASATTDTAHRTGEIA